MTTNHPAHGPVSLERLHQIREILSKASAQSDGGNLGYAMADAVKVIDWAIAAFGAEPAPVDIEMLATVLRNAPLAPSDSQGKPRAPVVPVSVPDEIDRWQAIDDIRDYDESFSWDSADGYEAGWNACRAAMLQAGNSPSTPDGWIPVSERMPEAHEPIYIFHPDYGVDEGVWYDNQEDSFLWDSDCSRCRAIETVSHWMPMPALPAAPQQEVK